MYEIQFFEEDISYTLANPGHTISWLGNVIEQEGFDVGVINYIFCSDSYLHKMNVDFLSHDTLTDIITFDMSETENEISGDIYISIDRIIENADKLSVSINDELSRVLVHGVLHLIGYSDKTNDEKVAMRKKEESCLSLRNY